jgi:DNA-binding NarL/FixJ family response regulator
MEKMRCVIADDSVITRSRVRSYLESAGHQVVGVAKNGKEGYELCVQQRPDIAIFDIAMPVMAGDVAGLKVRAERLVPFVFICSSQMQAATIDRIKAAGCHIISKPFKHDKFVGAIEAAISGKPLE